VPKGEMTVSWNKISAEDSPIVLQTTHNWTLA
jgi:hypothetical protein